MKKFWPFSQKTDSTKTKLNQIKIDIGLVQKYGLEEALLIGILLDPSFMLLRGRTSGFCQTMRCEYPWNMRTIEGRTLFSFSNTDLEVLLPFWDATHSREVFNSLIEKDVLETQDGSSEIHYNFKQKILNDLLSLYL